jgi:hypothetical protein
MQNLAAAGVPKWSVNYPLHPQRDAAPQPRQSGPERVSLAAELRSRRHGLIMRVGSSAPSRMQRRDGTASMGDNSD